MAKGNKNARAVQRATGWPYMRALRFVRDEDRSREARILMAEETSTTDSMAKRWREAFVTIAKAHLEVDDEG